MSKLQVQIQDYQIIQKAKLEFDEGLTVIIGPSNNGKTAILRAIESAIYNKVGSSFIRKGAPSAVVGIKNDNHTVIWRKTEGSGFYKVDGQDYNKIGRGQLVEVSDALQMSEVDVNTDKVRLNFLRQMEYPFLLDKTPSQLFEFLSMSNDNDKLTKIFHSMRSDYKATNSQVDLLTGKVDSYREVVSREEVVLNNYKSVDKTIENIIKLDSRVVQYKQLEDMILDIESKYQELYALRDRIVELRKHKESLSKLISQMETIVDTTSNLFTMVDDISSRRAELTTLADSIKQKRKIVSAIDLSQAESMLSNISILSDIVSLFERYTKSDDHIEHLRSSITSVQEELNNFKTCPLCGHVLSED